MPEVSFGDLLRDRRKKSEDPGTGAPYTQERLGELLGVSAKLISAWETSAQAPPLLPEYFNRLAELLPVKTLELLQAAGLNVAPETLVPLEREMLAAFRRLGRWPGLQESAIRLVDALPPPSQERSRVRRRHGRLHPGAEE